jgi:hypothetical protein
VISVHLKSDHENDSNQFLIAVSIAKFIMTTIPLLLGEKNLEQWKFILRRTLKDIQLCQYIDAVIPEPQGEDQKRQWEDDRAIANLLITASLTHDTTWQTLINNGWNPEEEDPRATYETVLRAILMVSEPAVRTIIASKKWHQKEASVKVMHCRDCGKCHGGQVCWKKCPELAPDSWKNNQRNAKNASGKTARSTIAVADQTSRLGYGNSHAKINSIWNPTENEIIRANTVGFEGPDFNTKTDEQEPQDEVVFTDPTVDEVEKRPSIGVTEIITNTSNKGIRQTTTPTYYIPTCDMQEQGTQGLPTPQATAELDLHVSEIRLIAEDVANIVHEAPILSKDPIGGLSTPEATPERDIWPSEIEVIQLKAENVADIARGHQFLQRQNVILRFPKCN